MKVLIAIDSFKGSLSSLEAGETVAAAAREAGFDPTVCPMADGGEGTLDAFFAARGGEIVEVRVSSPLGEAVTAKYLVSGRRAVIESAEAAGLTLSPERDVMRASTCGLGELIRDAIGRGCRDFTVGLGGSATNDGGTGMLASLGYRFTDEAGEAIPLGAAGLERLAHIGRDATLPELSECTFRVLCDVKNPLCGPLGCSAVFAPQKGATPEQVKTMDAWLARYAALAGGEPDEPGAGAAGGLGYAFMNFTDAALVPGIDTLIDEAGIEELMRDCDLVVTGEGKIDRQSAMGKVPAGVAACAKKYGKKVIAFCGIAGEGAEELYPLGVDAIFPILRRITTLEEAMRPETARENLAFTACQVFEII